MSEFVITPLGTVAPYCKGNKNCPGYLLEYKGQRYLFDCGNGITRRMNFPEDLKNLKVIISHLHPDHYGDLSSLIQTVFVYQKLGYIDKELEIFLPSDDIIVVSQGYGWPAPKIKKQKLMDYQYIHSFEKDYPVKIKDYSNLNSIDENIKITTLEVPHSIKSFAIRMDTPCGSVVYSSDTGTNNCLREFAKNADLFICESTFLRGQVREGDNHLFAFEAAQIAKDASVKKLLLTHFWPEIQKEEYVREAREIFLNTEAAEEGKRLVLRRNKS